MVSRWETVAAVPWGGGGSSWKEMRFLRGVVASFGAWKFPLRLCFGLMGEPSAPTETDA